MRLLLRAPGRHYLLDPNLVAPPTRDRPLAVGVAAWIWIYIGISGTLVALGVWANLGEGAPAPLLVLLVIYGGFSTIGLSVRKGRPWAYPAALVLGGIATVAMIALTTIFIVAGGEGGYAAVMLLGGVFYYGPFILLLLPSSRRWYRAIRAGRMTRSSSTH